MIPFPLFFLVALLIGLLIVFGLWLFYDLRDRHLFDDQRRLRVFHCLHCDLLYAGTRAQPVCACPRCRRTHARLRF